MPICSQVEWLVVWWSGGRDAGRAIRSVFLGLVWNPNARHNYAQLFIFLQLREWFYPWLPIELTDLLRLNHRLFLESGIHYGTNFFMWCSCFLIAYTCLYKLTSIRWVELRELARETAFLSIAWRSQKQPKLACLSKPNMLSFQSMT